MTERADGNAVDVVVRCRNEMPWTERALQGLAIQEGVEPRILFIDCHSDDGSREAAASRGLAVDDLDPEAYIPGRVLNTAMRRTSSDVVAFINADAVPLASDAVHGLVAPLRDRPELAATYGRQLPRREADALTRSDYARAFPPASALQTRFGTFFSMAASAIRRSVWERLPFDEELRYSEDADWVHRALALGWEIAYVPEACFEHSHAYDLAGHFRRRRGEGIADRLIYRLGPPTLARDLLRPLTGAMWRDLWAGAGSPQGAVVRMAQAAGYFIGRRHTRWR